MSEDNGKEPAEKRLEPGERLEIENLHLRAQAVGKDIQLLQIQVQAKHKELQELHQQILAKRAEIEKKYDIDLNTHEVREKDGVIVPRAGQG